MFIREEDSAIEHLFRVSCGLDSMVVGETQILGQVRSSFFTGAEYENDGYNFSMNCLSKQLLLPSVHTQRQRLAAMLFLLATQR
ncbi:hypothetical protein GCM10020331_034700 [Ectobacillus funiculus]